MRWFEGWKSDLPDGTACGGEDIFFDPAFEALQAEVNKNDGLQPDVRTDWRLVLEMATNLLSSRVKDLWVFCYGCRAVYEQNGISGLSAALEITTHYVTICWDDLYPPAARPARRAAPLLWLVGKLEILMPAGNFPVERQEAYEALRQSLSALQAALDAHMGENAPSFRNILRAIPVKKETPPPRPTAPVTPAPSPAPPPVLPSESARVVSNLNGDGRVPDSILPQLLRATIEQTQQLGMHYLSQDMRDWRVYLLHRTALWTTVVQLPPANGEKVTQLRMVLPQDKALAYSSAVSSKQYESVLPQLERTMSKAPFWFDGHHLVVQCLDALGIHDARDIVCQVLRCFLQRYPELLGYKFHDGTPFASAATVQWLETLRNKIPTEEDKKISVQPGDAEHVLREDRLLSQAVAIAEEQNFERGLASLGPGVSGKSRQAILHGLLLARYCLRAGRPKAGRELLQELYSRLESWDLLDWEPELGAKILALLVQSGGSKGQEAMCRRLYSLQAEAAIKLFE